MNKPNLNWGYHKGEIDDDLPYVGELKVDPETDHVYDEEGDVLDKETYHCLCCEDGRGKDE